VRPAGVVLDPRFRSPVNVIKTSEGLVLVDSGLESDCRSLLMQLQQLDLDPMQLKKILLTHAHGDHVLGANYLARLTGAQVYAGAADCDVLRAGGPREAMFSTFDMPGIETHPTEVDVELSGGETIELGECRFEVIGTPGHTPGSLCFVLTIDNQRILFSGDTISSITGDLGIYVTYLAPRFRANAADYLASLRKLLSQPAPDLLLPGHPRTAEITPAEWGALLGRGIRELEQLVERYATDGADFLDRTPSEPLKGLHYLGDFSGTAIYLLADRDRLILFDAPGGPGLVEFLDKRLKPLGRSVDDLTALLLTSCSVEMTGGLLPLVRRSGCPVIVSPTCLEQIKERLGASSTVLPAEGSIDPRIAPVLSIPLRGRGPGPVAYEFQWDSKTVLVTGEFLSKMTGLAGMQQLSEALEGLDGDRVAYAESLNRLTRLAPDLWLPAHPVHDQNANLYDRQWSEIIGRNLQAVRAASKR